MIHPPYIHYTAFGQGSAGFLVDSAPFLPVGPMYAAELLEKMGEATVDYFDCQLQDLYAFRNYGSYDCIAIAVMGAQNIAAAVEVFRGVRTHVAPDRVYLGGQGVESLSEVEFQRIFPGAHSVSRECLLWHSSYWEVHLDRQLEKLTETDLRTYLSNELTLLFSQGCIYGCKFCGAQTQQRESFFNTRHNLETFARLACEHGIGRLKFYVTSLDFFQQFLPGGRPELLLSRLRDVIAIRERYRLDIELRALTRADSYNAAMASQEVLSLVKTAGFRTFGFGADGAASVSLLRAMKKGSDNLRSDLLMAFAHAEHHGLVPEILYVFGIPEDTPETLAETKALCVGLLREFPNSVYRGFPAKNAIPGNRNWQDVARRNDTCYRRLLEQPALFANLGFETLANSVSHGDVGVRKAVNRYAVEMSYTAHELNRVQSYLTIPIEASGEDSLGLLDPASFDLFREIIRLYARDLADDVELYSLANYRVALNRLMPKDK